MLLRLVSISSLVLALGSPGVISAQFSALADCTGTSATPAISNITHSCSTDEVDADGTWSVSNADGVQLRYFIGLTEYQEEDKVGTSGTWDFVDDFSASPDTYTLSVKACPRVWNGSGYTVCLRHCTTDSDTFEVESCGPLVATITDCEWTCNGSDCSGTCEGTASGGTSPYTPTWGVDDGSSIQWLPNTGEESPPFQTPFSISCTMPFEEVVLDVTDAVNDSDRDTWPCGAD